MITANHNFPPTRQILKRENNSQTPFLLAKYVVRTTADTIGIKTPNNLTMLLTPSEIWEESMMRKIQIDHERM